MKEIVVINGSGGVGKDTFINLFSTFANTHSYSSVQKVKKIAEQMGWYKYDKSEKDRKFLSDLKLLWADYNDKPYESLGTAILEFKYCYNLDVLFLHVREPDEIKRLQSEYDVKTLLIKSKNVNKIESNMADKYVEEFEYDYIVNNDGTLEDLLYEAGKFHSWLGGNEWKFGSRISLGS